jgi:release factor glutamine methyltransferase
VAVIPGLEAGVSLQDACDTMAAAFRAGGIDSAQADARILAADALSLTRAQLISQSDRRLAPGEIEAMSLRAARRLNREPVSRIVGYREFWGLRLAIAPSVLDPRPDTETVIETALDWIATRGLRNERLRILDIGTGSGALLLALLAELPRAYGIATDRSIAALGIASANAAQLGFASRCAMVACNYADAIRGPLDLVVSNPPYISTREIGSLDPEVREHDPMMALDGGADGFDAYRAIASDGLRLLAPRGRLILELGEGQADAVTAIVKDAGLSVESSARRDLAGIRRALCATTP